MLCLSETARAGAPVDDLGFINDEAMVIGCRQAGRVTDSAVDVDDHTARSTDRVVVVVSDPRLVARYGTRWLDTTDETRIGQRAQYVVDGLVGNLAESRASCPNDRVRVRVRKIVHGSQHSQPWPRHP